LTFTGVLVSITGIWEYTRAYRLSNNTKETQKFYTENNKDEEQQIND
jgi:hypothetical protein